MSLNNTITEALQANHPVVALESTVIAHGLPYPHNVETARAMEEAVRKSGAEPATVGILDGQVRIGLDRSEVERLAREKDVRKCSPRDLPIAAGLGQTGATTVAATMRLAHAAGIQVFATGGIGGVHRGHPFDVSADLVELGRTPMAVVCAGAKAILDLPLTLERLETEGVTVIGYQSDTFPAFFCRSSGLPVDQRCDTLEEVAHIIRARDRLALEAAVLVTVPVPEAQALPEKVGGQAVEEALAEAEAQSITGKDLTPFLLGKVAELTGTRSREANQALLINNAHKAAELACCLI